MEKSTHNTIMLHDKLANSDSFLLLCGIFLFSDAFLLINYQVSLYVVSFNWYKENISSNDIIKYLFVFSFFYGAFIPFLLWSIDNLLQLKISARSSIHSFLIKLEDLKNNAIIENNSAAYKHFENKAAKLEKLESRRKLCLAIMILTGIVLVKSSFSVNHQNILSSIITNALEDGFLPSITRFSLFIFSIWLFVNIMNATDHFANSEIISNYQDRLHGKWISEVTSGLLDRELLFKHLNNINEYSLDLYTSSSEYDYNNASHAFCKTHGLIKTNNGNIEFTEKGEFFKKYKSSHKQI